METQSATTPRLVRRRDGRIIAGVCKGIADHFNIEPVLVRVGFIVASFFGGAGAIAYVAAWLLIPEEDDRTSIGERIVCEHRWGRIAGFALIAIALSTLLRPVWWWGGHGFFPVLLIIGGLYLLSPGVRFRRDDVAADAQPPAPPAEPPVTQEMSTPPPPPRAPRPRRRAGLGALTFGLLFVAGGIVLAAGNSVEPTYVFAVGLMIVGAALVLSTWIGRSFTLIPLGLLLLGLMSVSTVIDVPITGGIGEKRERPSTVADLRQEYQFGIGELQLDLRNIPFARGTTHEVKATVGIGHLLVRVPRNVTVEIHGHTGMGEVRLFGEHNDGVDVDRDMTLTSAGESPPRIVLDVEAGIGQVEVTDEAA